MFPESLGHILDNNNDFVIIIIIIIVIIIILTHCTALSISVPSGTHDASRLLLRVNFLVLCLSRCLSAHLGSIRCLSHLKGPL